MEKSELNWTHIQAIIDIEGELYAESGGNAKAVVEKYPTAELFYGEILKRFLER